MTRGALRAARHGRARERVQDSAGHRFATASPAQRARALARRLAHNADMQVSRSSRSCRRPGTVTAPSETGRRRSDPAAGRRHAAFYAGPSTSESCSRGRSATCRRYLRSATRPCATCATRSIEVGLQHACAQPGVHDGAATLCSAAENEDRLNEEMRQLRERSAAQVCGLTPSREPVAAG